jgi:(1->4)-alpha-D-glucan 1-alpha-D-glucosylmutase
MTPPNLPPRATYRLQLNRDFTFAQATEIVPYLSELGISHCYISPCLRARPGSMHGYDIVDHNSLNPEIGSPEEFDHFVNTLHRHDMGLILDIVPNHMAVMGSDNAWWLDVLENGQSSPYASFFDIDWRPLKEELHGKVLVPVLHDHYGAVIESGELKLAFHQETGQFDIFYRGHRFPIGPREYPRILRPSADVLVAQLGAEHPDVLEFQSLITAFGHLPGRHEVSNELLAERHRDKEIHKRRLAALCARTPAMPAAIGDAVAAINGTPTESASFEALHELIKAQTFRLANWRVAADDINYRRFFDTNDLAGLRTENEAVFEATHRLVLQFVSLGKVDGLRVDHPDGLYNPAQYFERLKASMAERTPGTSPESRYVVIEKILTGSERLPTEWPVSGTTGYDFANLVNGLFVDTAAAARFDRIYANFIGEKISYDDLAYHCRKLIIRVALASELNVLANQLAHIALSKRRTCDFTLNSLRDALSEIVASFPVYRTYITSAGVSNHDEQYIRRAIASAKWRTPAVDTSVFDFIEAVLLTQIADGQDAAYRNHVTAFAMKFQQFTSPVMAKGLEDTAFYRYNRLISLNDVGGDLHRFGIGAPEFHAANQERLRDWPHTMLGTSTHDSKRSEDVRARINVLSEMPGAWRLRLRDWKRLNRDRRKIVNGQPAPAPNDEYLLYQTLLGVWPSEPLGDENDWHVFRNRIENYMLKAMREAKQHTSWINRNEDYETAVSSFVRDLLTPGESNLFLHDFLPFQSRVARLGLWNSLSQTLLKLTVPGVPDVYQGNDLLDLSLVDPDNRRPVDYLRRHQILKTLAAAGSLDHSLASSSIASVDDRLKLFVTREALRVRKRCPELFRQGEYLPLAAHGAKSNHAIAFVRKLGAFSVLVVVPRLIATLVGENQGAPIGPDIWKDSYLQLPPCGCLPTYRKAFSGSLLQTRIGEAGPQISLGDALAEFPVGLYVSEKKLAPGS